MENDPYVTNPGALYARVDKKRKRQGLVKAPATIIHLENYYFVAHSTPVVVTSSIETEKNHATLPLSASGENRINAEYCRLDRDTLFNSCNGLPSPRNAKNRHCSDRTFGFRSSGLSVLIYCHHYCLGGRYRREQVGN